MAIRQKVTHNMNFYDTYRIHQHEANQRREQAHRQRMADEASRDRRQRKSQKPHRA